ncbi:hypothetical protein D9599_29265 [Roseomonas sp. KE2513]|nr:hypothetical protein [Roseomonas sp. KE2513]
MLFQRSALASRCYWPSGRALLVTALTTAVCVTGLIVADTVVHCLGLEDFRRVAACTGTN